MTKEKSVSWQNFLSVIGLVLTFQVGGFLFLYQQIEAVNTFNTDQRVRVWQRVNEIHELVRAASGEMQGLKTAVERDRQTQERILDRMERILDYLQRKPESSR